MGAYLTTRELAELLRIKERKVYDLAASGAIPCSRAMGKLLFPRAAVEAWVAGNSTGPAAAPARPVRPSVFLGSHDPLLEWALRESRSGLATFFDGSLDGLERFDRGEGVATGLHVPDSGGGEWNLPLVAARFASAPVVLVEWAWRERGLIVGSADAEIAGVADLRGRRVAPRQPEAGSQRLLEQLLSAAGLDADAIVPTPVCRTETDAALAVLEGKADATLGLRAVAAQYRLGFVPVTRERFDLLVDRRAWFEPPLQQLVGFCRSEAFVRRAGELGGYDVGGLGRVRFNGP